jgi:hypothetical protein
MAEPFRGPSDPLLTLEPLLDAVRDGLEGAGWDLSGLQKTTSYEFEGRWAGDSSRSAYLFFHRTDLPEWVSLDVFLDETTRGLRGNLALVLDGPELEGLGPPGDVLEGLAEVARRFLPPRYRTPITLRFRLPNLDTSGGEAETEYRIKLQIPAEACNAGQEAVSALASAVAGAFQALLESGELTPYMDGGPERGD